MVLPISYVGTSTQATSTGSPLTCNLPSGYTTDDLLIAVITTREDSPTPVHGITTSSVSWTQIGSTQFLDLGTTGIAQSVWYRWAASGSETAPSASCPTPNVLAVTISAFRNVDKTTPLDGVTVQGGTAAAAATLQPNGGTGITTTTNGAWVVSVVSTSDDNALNLSTANGFTLQYGGTSYDTTDGGDCAQALATILKSTAGNQTAPTFNQSTNGDDSWAWSNFVLKPRPGLSGDIGQVTETDTVQAVGRVKRKPVGVAGPQDVPFTSTFASGIEGWKSYVVGSGGSFAWTDSDGHDSTGCLTVTTGSDGWGVHYEYLYSITPGEALVATAWVKGTTGKTHRLYLQFEDSTGTIVGGDFYDTRAASTGVWQSLTAYCSSVPATAVKCRLIVQNSAPSANTFLVDDVRLRRNGASNPTFDSNITGWDAKGGATLAQETTTVRTGGGAIKVTAPASANQVGFGQDCGAFTEGVKYQGSAWVRSGTYTGTVDASLEAYTSGWGLISSARSGAVQPNGTGWTEVATPVFTIPANCAHLVFQIDSREVVPGSGTTYFADDVWRTIVSDAQGDVALAATRQKRKTLGVATETDTAQAITSPSSGTPVAQASESDTAQAVGRVKRKTLGIATSGSQQAEQWVVTGRFQGVSSARSAPWVSNTFTPAANSLLVVVTGCETDGNDVDPALDTSIITDSAGLTWTRRATTGVLDNGDNWQGGGSVFTAPVGANPTSMTVTIDFHPSSGSLSFYPGMAVFDITGHDSTTPFPQVVAVAADKWPGGNSSASLSPTLGSTPTSGNLLLLIGWAENDAFGTFTGPGAGWTELYNNGSSFSHTGVWYRSDSTATSATVSDLGQSVFYGGVFLAEITNAVTGGAGDQAQPVTRRHSRTLGQATETDLAQTILKGGGTAVGLVTETDTAQAIGKRKSKAVGLVTETDEAQRVGKGKRTGLSTETDTAQTLTHTKRRAVGQAAETDAAQTFAHTKRKAVGQATETDLAQTTGKRRAYAVGLATETDDALSVTRPSGLGLVTETDLAQTIGRRKSKAVGQAAETDTAQTTSKGRAKAVGPVAETDLAQAVGRRKSKAVGQVSETDAALALAKRKAVGLVAETDAAQTAGRRKRKAVGLVAETDAAQTLTHTKRKTVGQAAETDAALTVLKGAGQYPVGQTTETDTAQPVGRRKRKAVGLVTETDASLTATRSSRRTLGLPSETDTAQTIGRRKRQPVGLATETDLAQTVGKAARQIAVGQASETGTALAVAKVKRHAVEVTTESDVVLAVGRVKRMAVGLAVETDSALDITAKPTFGNLHGVERSLAGVRGKARAGSSLAPRIKAGPTLTGRSII